MKIKQTIIILGTVIGLGGLFLSPSTVAAESCGGVKTSIIHCDKTGQCKGGENPFEGTDPKGDATKLRDYSTKYDHNYGMCKDNVPPDTSIEDSGAWGILVLAIQIMTAGIGVLAVGGIVYGAILYTTAGGSPEQVKKGRTVITNVVIGLVAYGFMYAILNFIIPGGLFK